METARFQIVSGVLVGGRLQPPWPVVPRAVGPAPLPDGARTPDESTTWYGWRLLSRNHRDVARSPAVHATPSACLASIASVRRAAVGAETVLERNPATGRWTWYLATPDGIVATGSRGYLRRRECHDCVAQVVELVAVALDPESRVVVAARPGPRSRTPGTDPELPPDG